MRIHKILFFLSIITLISSCSKSNEVEEDFTEIEKVAQYDIVDLHFDKSNASIDKIIERRPTLYYSNNTSVIQKVAVNSKNIFETSRFKPQDSFNYQLIDSNKFFAVPSQFIDGKFFYGEKKWKFSDNDIKLQTELNFEDSFEVAARKEMKLDFSFIYDRYKIPFSVILKNIASNDLITVKGEWTGIFLVDTKSNQEIRDL